MPKPLQYRITTIVNQNGDTRYRAHRKDFLFWEQIYVEGGRSEFTRDRQDALLAIKEDARMLRATHWTVVSHENIKV